MSLAERGHGCRFPEKQQNVSEAESQRRRGFQDSDAVQPSDRHFSWSVHLKLGLVILEELARAGYTEKKNATVEATPPKHMNTHWLTTAKSRLFCD